MTERPTHPHPFVQADGNPTKFKRMTETLCPTCNPASGGAKLGVTSDANNTLALECEHCGYTEYQLIK